MKAIDDKITTAKSKEFKELVKINVPIVMSDLSNIDKMKEVLESLEGMASFELEDYIEQLEIIGKDFTSHISNNLKIYGMKEGVLEVTNSILNKIVILGTSTSEYNCHGWSLGSVSNIPLSQKKINFQKEIDLYSSFKDYKNKTDFNTFSYFSKKSFAPIFKNNTEPSYKESSIVAYYGKDEIISHTARYIQDVNWYTREEEYYGEWYNKDKGMIKFDESGTNCTINSYTSKLGLGYLIAHDVKDLVPLYGEDIDFYDLAF